MSTKKDTNDIIQPATTTTASVDIDEEEHSSITYIEPNDELITEEEVAQEDLFLKMVSNEVEYKKLLNQSRKLYVCISCAHVVQYLSLTSSSIHSICTN